MMAFVDLWRATLTRSSQEIATLARFLDAPEIARANAFRSERDRRRFIVSRATLRCLLARYIGNRPEGVTFVGSPQGKPEVSDNRLGSSLHFNLSHSADVLLCAIADRKVGVDVETMKHHDDMARVALHFFSSEESRRFFDLADVERTEFFFRTWVRKEAFVKATGEGLSRDTRGFTVQMPPSAGIVVHSADGSRHVDDSFRVYDLPDIGENLAAIALEGGDATTSFQYREWPE
jgi:4'-phosphopantetheinyl transferase